MKKRISAIIALLVFAAAIILTFVPVVPSHADSSKGTPRVTDDADLLSDSEERQLEDKLAKISEKYDCDVIVLTVDNIGSVDPNKYANDFFTSNGFGMGKADSGVSLMISIESRDWAVTAHSTSAKKGAQKIFPYTKTDAIGEYILNDLSAGNYYRAFDGYADKVESYLHQYKLKRIAVIPIAIVLGAIISLIIMSGQKATLKSVHTQPAARSYLVTSNVSGTDTAGRVANAQNANNIGKGVAAGVAAGILLSIATDQFLYSNVTKTAKESSSSGGGSISHSSGGGYSGSHGKF